MGSVPLGIYLKVELMALVSGREAFRGLHASA
jgi:hypothetical protein